MEDTFRDQEKVPEQLEELGELALNQCADEKIRWEVLLYHRVHSECS